MEDEKTAKIGADYIINNLDNIKIQDQFTEPEFKKEQIYKLIEKINNSCDWQNRKGHFVDYTTISTNGQFDVAFIYEYFLKCDSLRFILIYNLDSDDPKLIKFGIEPLSKQSPLVIHKERQLLKY